MPPKRGPRVGPRRGPRRYQPNMELGVSVVCVVGEKTELRKLIVKLLFDDGGQRI